MPIVKFFAGLRKAAGTKETTIEATSLLAALDEVAARYPALQEQVWDGESLGAHIVITVNGHTLDLVKNLNLQLLPEDEIAIFPPIAGG